MIRDAEWIMSIALEEAEKAYKSGEVPVGAVVVGPNGEVISRAHNLKEELKDPTAHAEIIAIKEASKNLDRWRLLDCKIYVTLEPCPMCLSAISQSRFKQLIFGAYDKKGGALSLGFNFNRDKRLNHKFSVLSGVKHYECSNLMSNFFKQRRK